MLFGKTKLELKVGVFVLIGMAILVMFVLFIGDFRSWSSGYTKLNFVFNFVNGIKLGAPVRFAGVDIGEVKEMGFFVDPQENKTKVRVTTSIKQEIKIPHDSQVWVNTLGLLGEKYIEVMPGTDYSRYLAPGATLTGVDPIAMHEVGDMAKNIVDDLDEVILKIKNSEGTIGKLLSDDTVYNDIEALVKDLRAHPWKIFFKTKEKPIKK